MAFVQLDEQLARRAEAAQRWSSFPASTQRQLSELYAAIFCGGHLQRVQHWWEANGSSFCIDTQVNQDGQSALYVASRNGHTEIIRYLVEVCGANLDLKEEFFGRSPLIGAVFPTQSNSTTQHECIRLLLELGADADLRDDDGKTALDWARQLGSQGCIDLLRAPTVKSASKG